MKPGVISHFVAGFIAVFMIASADTALAESKAQKAFLESIKAVSTIDGAHISEGALVIWPSPPVQGALDYDVMAEKLCLEYKTYGYLVIWFMDSSKYRRSKEMAMLQSHVCLEDGQ